MDISKLDVQLTERAALITNDYFTLAKTEAGFITLRNKSYLSNVVKAGFNQSFSPYSNSPEIFENILGTVSDWELTNVEDKGLVKRFQYTAKASLQEKPIEFLIDINEDYRLSKIFLYIEDSASGQRVNIFKDAYIKF